MQERYAPQPGIGNATRIRHGVIIKQMPEYMSDYEQLTKLQSLIAFPSMWPNISPIHFPVQNPQHRMNNMMPKRNLTDALNRAKSSSYPRGPSWPNKSDPNALSQAIITEFSYTNQGHHPRNNVQILLKIICMNDEDKPTCF